MKTLLKTIAILALLSNTAYAQTNFYVDGNASTNGTGTFASPFNKIMFAIWATTNNSYTNINIRGGTYHENLWIDKSGLPNGYLTIQPYQAEQVIIDGTGTATKEGLIVQSSNYVRVQGLIVRNFLGNSAIGIGVYCVNGNSSYIEILNNEIYQISQPLLTPQPSDNAFPLVVYGDSFSANPYFISNILIANNKVHDCNTGYSEGVQINYDTRNFEVRNNEVYNIRGIGIVAAGFHGGLDKKATNGKIWLNKVYNCKSPIAQAAGIYIDGAKNVVAERNIVFGCQKGMAINCEVPNKITENDTLRNNFVYSNTRGAFNLGGYNTANGGRVINSAIINNSTFQNFDPNILEPQETSPVDFGEITIAYATDSKVMNNIFNAGNHTKLLNCQYPSVPSNLILNHNDWYANVSLASDAFRYFTCTNDNFNAYKTCSLQDQNSVFGNPYFQQGATGNLRIRCASVAINLGLNSIYGGQNDYFGEARKLGSNIDAGADEFERYKHLSSQSGNWQNTSTWQTNLVPLPCDDILLKSSHKINLTSGQSASCKTIQSEPNSVFDCPRGAIFIANPAN